MNYWVAIYRFALVMAIVLCVVGGACIFVPKVQSYRELQARKAALARENAGTEARLKELERRQARFENDPAFVERVAREHGMAKPGETVYRVTNGAASP
jgi:cell division protein FtsB